MNCLIVDDDELTRIIIETYVSKTPFLRLVKNCSSAIEASNVLMEEKIDIIFLDFHMPGMNGIELVKSLGEPKPLVIMITANKEHASDAYNFDITDFIVKPITQERFLKALSKAKKIFDGKGESILADHDIFVRANSMLVKINTKDISFIEARADYISIHAGTQKFTVHITMKEITTKLPSSHFMRVHHSFIVRLDKISKIDENILVVHDKHIPVSRAHKQGLMNRLKVI